MATETVYTSPARVKALLPRSYSTTDLPDSSDSSLVSLATLSIDVSRVIDSRIGDVYCSFNSWNHATYPTPRKIIDIASKGTAGRALRQLGLGDRNVGSAVRAVGYEGEFDVALAAMRGDAQPGADAVSLPLETVTTETLTFGTGALYGLQSYEAFFSVTDYVTTGDIPTMVEESVRVLTSGLTNYRFGTDFVIEFRPEYQKWVFVDATGALAASGSAKTVTYKFDWKRHAQRPASANAAPMYLGVW